MKLLTEIIEIAKRGGLVLSTWALKEAAPAFLQACTNGTSTSTTESSAELIKEGVLAGISGPNFATASILISHATEHALPRRVFLFSETANN